MDFENIDQLKAFLEDVPITKCNEILFSMMGLSLANFNLIVSILLITWTCAILKLDEQK